MPLTLVENPGRHWLEGLLLLVDCLIGLFVFGSLLSLFSFCDVCAVDGGALLASFSAHAASFPG